MNLKCLGCSGTAQKPLLGLTPSAQGSRWAGNGSNLRISWTLQCWARRAQSRYPTLQELCENLCVSPGDAGIPPSPHHSNNQNYGSLGGKGNINSSNNKKPKKKSLKLKLKVFKYFFLLFLGSEYLDPYPSPGSETVAAWVAEQLLGLESWFVVQCLALLALSPSERINLWRHRCAHTGLNSVLLLQALPCK